MSGFTCKHPRGHGDAHTAHCKTCGRIKAIVQKAERDQARLNAGRFYTRGERIARGLA